MSVFFYLRELWKVYMITYYICCWSLFWAMESKHCKTDWSGVCKGSTLKNKSQLVTFHENILVSLWTFRWSSYMIKARIICSNDLLLLILKIWELFCDIYISERERERERDGREREREREMGERERERDSCLKIAMFYCWKHTVTVNSFKEKHLNLPWFCVWLC